MIPTRFLTALTRHNATFTTRELERFLEKHLAEPAERRAVKLRVLMREDVVPLYDRDTGERAGRFTIGAVREQERVALADAAALAGRSGAAVSTAVAARGLRPDQQRAFVHAVDAGGLKLIGGGPVPARAMFSA